MNNKTVFVVGNSRSGTTMLGSMLNQNSKIYRFEELHFFEYKWSPTQMGQEITAEAAKSLLGHLFFLERENGLFLTDMNSLENYHKDVEHVIEALEGVLTAEDVFKAFLFYETNQQKKQIPCEQTPKNLYYINEIKQIFPKVKVINMMRDPRDVLLSQKNKWKVKKLGVSVIPYKEVIRSWVNYHPFVISKLWNSSVKQYIKHSNDDLVINIKFEDLLSDPKQVVMEICEHIGIAYEDTMLDIPQIGSSTVVSDVKKRGIDISRKSGWKRGGLTNEELYICQKINQNEMTKFGYELTVVEPNRINLFIMYMYMPFKLLISLLMNLHRMKNIFETIKRRLG